MSKKYIPEHSKSALNGYNISVIHWKHSLESGLIYSFYPTFYNQVLKAGSLSLRCVFTPRCQQTSDLLGKKGWGLKSFL